LVKKLMNIKLSYLLVPKQVTYRLSVVSASSLIERLNMPRDATINQELKKIRLKVKEKALKYPPGSVSLQVNLSTTRYKTTFSSVLC